MYNKKEYRKMRTPKDDNKRMRYYPALMNSSHETCDDAGDPVEIRVAWLYKDLTDALGIVYAGVDVIDAQGKRSGTLMGWDLYSGVIVDGGNYLRDANCYYSMINIIHGFGAAMKLEYEVSQKRPAANKVKSNSQKKTRKSAAQGQDRTPDNMRSANSPAYNPENKKPTASSISKTKMRRGKDDAAYVVMVAGYFTRNGRYVKAHARRLPLRKKVA